MNKIEMSHYFKRHKKEILIITVLYLLIVVTSVSIPYLLGSTITSLETGQITKKLLLVSFLKVAGVYVLWNVFAALLEIQFEKTNKEIENTIKIDAIRIILRGKYAAFEKHSKGEILNKIVRDTQKIEKAFSQGYSLVTAIIHSLSLLIIMFVISYKLTIVVSILFALIILIQKVTSNSLGNLYIKFKTTDELLFRKIRNILKGFKTIKVFALEEVSLKDLKESAQETYHDYIKISKSQSIIKNINFFFSSIFRVSTIFIGGVLYLASQISIGQIFTIHSYSIQLAAHLRRIIELDIVIKDIKTSISRINDFLLGFEPESPRELDKLSEIQSIHLKDISFSYDDKLVLNQLNLKAKKGDIILLSGSNGAGKSTLASIIIGLQEVDGQVVYNNKIVHREEMPRIRDRIALVDQEVYLFPDTVMNNITCYDHDKKRLVLSLLDKLQLHDRFLHLKEGLETRVDEENTNLSGGEKQTIAFLRAMVSERDVIVLDEFTASLDVELKKLLLEHFNDLVDNKIVFIISHDEDTKLLANKVVTLTKLESA